LYYKLFITEIFRKMYTLLSKSQATIAIINKANKEGVNVNRTTEIS